MASPTQEQKGKTGQEIKRKQRRIFIHDRVEVRNMEHGLLGSWHEGVVVGRDGKNLCVRYDKEVEWVAESPLIEGTVNQDLGTIHGNIRPLPPKVVLSIWCLHYSKCVDVFHQDVWWEGVIFDEADGSDVRKVFFPDMGDEMSVKLRDMRPTQEWDEVSGEWKIRCDWLFMDLIVELEKDWPLIVSVKQIWYDLRADEAFQNIMEWTNNSRQLWKDLLLQVIFNNIELTAKQIFQTGNFECTNLGSQQSHESTQGGSNSKKHLSISPCTGDSKLITQREYVHVKNNCFPQAIEEYVNFEIRSSDSSKKNAVKVAKEHLCAVGWKFFLFHKKNRKELRYEAPCGKVFISLKRACIWYLSEERPPLSNTSTDEIVQKSKGLMAQTRLGSPPPLDREGNLITHDDFSANQFLDSSLMPSFSKGLNDAIRTQGSDVLQRKRKGNLITHDDFSANQFLDSSLMPSFSKGLNDAIRTQGSDVLQRKRMQGASQDLCVLLQMNNKDDLLGLPEKDTESEHFIKQMHDVNPERRAKQVGTPSTRQNPSTILSWLIDGNAILPRAIVFYRKKDGTSLKEGRVTRRGILCSCCEHVFNLSKFEAHAGSTYHRPAENIFLEDGRSIRECQLKLKCDKSAGSTRSDSQRAEDDQHTISNDQICSSCRYGGGLLLCDQCPSSYHKKCLGLKEVPVGDWFCPSCCCGICNSRRCNENAEPNINDRFLNCDQCERQYHMECLRSKGILKHDSCAEEDWFCNNMCEQIHAGLQKLLGKPVPIGIDNLTWTLLKYSKSEDSHQGNLNNYQLMECYNKLNVALEVMHECFEPVKEPLTGRDLVEDVIFSRWSKLSRLNFRGFYTVLLEKDEQLVTVATMRVYGEKVAEIPLVATGFEFRRQGMCRILMDEIEKKLMELGVRQMVLPSAPSVLKTWTNAFGFSVLSKSERLNFLSYTFLEFQGTVMCHKLVKNKPCDLSQRKERQQNVSEHMRRIDSTDVEGSTAVSKVIQVDGAKEIEMIQQSSRGIVSESDDQFVPSDVMVHTDTDSNSEESTDDDDYSVEYKRRKVSGRETYPSYKRKQRAVVA